MSIRASVVVPVHNGAQTLGDCLRALAAQEHPGDQHEIIIVDDGSTDATVAVATSFSVRLVRQPRRGAGAARNAGLRVARGEWVAFTDADCIPSRGWLCTLLETVARPVAVPALGAAGPILGYGSSTSPARFVDLSGGLDTARHLAHPRFPFPPSANLMYRRDALESIEGFDARYCAYEACDLHTRLRQKWEGEFHFVPHAVVFHRHRASWREYWRQQSGYGRGYGQFMLCHKAIVQWSLRHELRAWRDVAGAALGACGRGRDDEGLVRRGRLVKQLAQRLGFLTTYWNPRERARW
jgi:glycosyltransferase involved in cell wall biosynthesis